MCVSAVCIIFNSSSVAAVCIYLVFVLPSEIVRNGHHTILVCISTDFVCLVKFSMIGTKSVLYWKVESVINHIIRYLFASISSVHCVFSGVSFALKALLMAHLSDCLRVNELKQPKFSNTLHSFQNAHLSCKTDYHSTPLRMAKMRREFFAPEERIR